MVYKNKLITNKSKKERLTMKENELLLKRNLRDEVINEDRLEVLDNVKCIITIPNTILSTVEQVANYYEVGDKAINSLMGRNKEELESNGLIILKGTELKAFKGQLQDEVTLNKLKFASQLALFDKRAILNVAMLLEESQVAKEVRTLLLDNHFQLEDVHNKLINNEEIEIDKTSPTYFIDRETELREKEKSLSTEMTQAILKGDMNTYLKISCEVNGIKEEIIALAKEKEELSKSKVEGYDQFIGTENLLSWDTVAKNLGIGRNNLLKELRIHKILQTDTYEYRGKTYSGEHHNVPYQQYMKYFEVKFDTYGTKKKATTKVTASGQEYLFKKLKEWNLKIAN